MKIGDKIKSIRDHNRRPALRNGKNYIIRWIEADFLKVEGDSADYFHNRFELAKSDIDQLEIF